MTERLSHGRIRRLRGPKDTVDPRRPLAVFWEEERRPDGTTGPVLTVLITGAECPFTCVFCDLWRHTLDGPTPEGAIPAQLDAAFQEAGPIREDAWTKLYNASNWFDARAVPPVDDEALLQRLEPFTRVVVECHPRLVGERARRWARDLGPGRLQVALGLETVHPDVQPRLGKAASLDDFAAAIDDLHQAGATTRVFVLVGSPFLGPDEAAKWAARSADWAFEHGVEHVALVPLRVGNGAVDELIARGQSELPSLDMIEDAVDHCFERAPSGRIVTIDTWDLERHTGCASCTPARRRRLERMNLSGRPEPRILCAEC